MHHRRNETRLHNAQRHIERKMGIFDIPPETLIRKILALHGSDVLSEVRNFSLGSIAYDVVLKQTTLHTFVLFDIITQATTRYSL